MAKLTQEILNTVLEDDNTDFGGTAFAGERVCDFLESCGEHPATLEELNTLLVRCGIRPVGPIDSFFVTVFHRDVTYHFAGEDVRQMEDGGGNSILYVKGWDHDNNTVVLNLTPDWKVKSIYRYT